MTTSSSPLLLHLDKIKEKIHYATTDFTGRVLIYSACGLISILLHVIIVAISRTGVFGFGTADEKVMDVCLLTYRY